MCAWRCLSGSIEGSYNQETGAKEGVCSSRLPKSSEWIDIEIGKIIELTSVGKKVYLSHF